MKSNKEQLRKQIERALASLEALSDHFDKQGLTIECDLVDAATGHVQSVREML